MSQIENVITTTFRARGNQAIASMGSVAQGFGQVGRVINETTRRSELLNSQFRAMGTTIRYAIAGGAVFGLTRMVTQLKDIQQQLGLMQAIGQPAGGGIFSTQQITRLGNDLQGAAIRSLTPINEINDATINLLSTVQNVPQNEIPSMIQNIAQGAKLAQTPVEDLTKAITTMNIAFGRPNNARTIAQFNRMWFSLIKEAPGGVAAAPQIANQLPQLASMFALGQGPVSGAKSQQQMLSLVLGVLRTGTPPSTAVRGLTYLAQSIIQPTGKARGALAGIGITPQSIEREGVYANLMKLLNRITKLSPGARRRIGTMSDESLDAIDEAGGRLPGIPAAEMTRLRQMIPRIHGIRAAVILAGQLQGTGQTKSLAEDLQLMDQAMNNHTDQAHDMARAWSDFKKRSKLQEAATAIGTLKLQMAQALEPIINLAAKGISGVAGAAQHHRRFTRDAVMLGALGVGALGVGRFLGFGGAGRALVRANAIQAAMTPGGVLGDSPQNPLYVVVVGELFGSGKNVIPGPTGTPGGVVQEAEKVAKYGLGWKALRMVRAGGIRLATAAAGDVLLPAALSAAPVAALAVAVHALRHGNIDHPSQNPLGPRELHKALRHSPLTRDFIGAVYGQKKGIQPFYRDLLAGLMQGNVTPGQVERKLAGRAEIAMTIDVQQPGGRVERRRVHVPVDLWTGGRVPSSRGRKGK